MKYNKIITIICNECKNKSICKYRDSMENAIEKLNEITTPNEDGVIPVELASCFELSLKCRHFKSMVLVRQPDLDYYGKPIEFGTKRFGIPFKTTDRTLGYGTSENKPTLSTDNTVTTPSDFIPDEPISITPETTVEEVNNAVAKAEEEAFNKAAIDAEVRNSLLNRLQN